MVEQVGTGPETGGELAHEFLTEIGSRIRALRADRSLTVQQLADRSQISRRLLTQIELGQANPSLVTITRIARQLGVDFTDLLGAQPAETPIVVTDPDHHRLVWSSEAGSTAHSARRHGGQAFGRPMAVAARPWRHLPRPRRPCRLTRAVLCPQPEA